jgi:hypothetical protein
MSNKKTVRLTESEMVSLIENIVNQVKSEKKRKINESKSKKKSILRERHYRLLMEAAEAEITADIDELGEDPPENERESFLDKVESMIDSGKIKLEELKDGIAEALKGLFTKSKKPRKHSRYFKKKVFGKGLKSKGGEKRWYDGNQRNRG